MCVCVYPARDRQETDTWRGCKQRRHWAEMRLRSVTTAVGLPRTAACCNNAQHGCATTQPNLLPVRCSSASRVATALSRFVRRRNRQRCQSVAGSCDDATNTVAHPLQQRIACCNRAPDHNAANLLQRSATC